MKKRIFKKVVLSTVALGMFSVLGSQNKVFANDEDTSVNHIGETTEFPTNSVISNVDGNIFFSNKALSYPKSIDDYKRMGYKNITYSGWTQRDHPADSWGQIWDALSSYYFSKSPNKGLQLSGLVNDIYEDSQVQMANFLRVKSRRILATAPYGLEVLIGQEYYFTHQQVNKIVSSGHGFDLLPV